MKLLGRDFSADSVLSFVQSRLDARGLTDVAAPPLTTQVEARVDPLTFNLEALSEHADSTRGLPIESHRAGLGGQLVVAAKQVFRKAGQVLINETLGRQRLFNGHVRDSYAQLSSEVMRLRQQVADLETRLAAADQPPGKRRSSR